MKILRTILVASTIAASAVSMAQQGQQETTASKLPNGVSFYSINNDYYSHLALSPLVQKAKSCTQGNNEAYFGELREKTFDGGEKELILVIAGKTSSAELADVNHYSILTLDSQGGIPSNGTMGNQILKDNRIKMNWKDISGHSHRVDILFSAADRKVKSVKMGIIMVDSWKSLAAPFSDVQVDCQF